MIAKQRYVYFESLDLMKYFVEAISKKECSSLRGSLPEVLAGDDPSNPVFSIENRNCFIRQIGGFAMTLTFLRWLPYIVYLFFSCGLFAQDLTEHNFQHLYNPASPINFYKKLINTKQGFQFLFEVRHNASNDQISLVFEKRESLSSNNAIQIPAEQIYVDNSRRGIVRGTINLEHSDKIFVITTGITSVAGTFYYDQIVNNNYPVNGFLAGKDNSPVLNNYINRNDSVKIVLPHSDETEVSVFYYNRDFLTSAPPMAELPRTEKDLVADSVFTLKLTAALRFPKTGLYLVQADTNSAFGFAFRVENEFYPKYGRLADLPDPLMYITTRSEFEKLDKARDNKLEFDKTILEITKDTERAKNFMRNYYRRAEYANQYFTSFKEGWKTDRGMIYIIYGEPLQVFKKDDHETWVYETGNQRLRFSFAQSGSIFDPENHVLIRERRYADSWFRMVDLWRKGRI